MSRPSNLDDPDVSAYAWARYRRLMLWMAGAAGVTTAIALAFLHSRHPEASIHLFIAAAAGVFMSVLLGAGLMGLVFLSSGSGHDEAIDDRLEEERNRDT
jgi:lipopolysaccharide export LptBFGC system permease protein LptF